jgi:hypothetical protein
MLTEHDDVDTADTALRVARLAPRTRFARTVRAIDESRVA